MKDLLERSLNRRLNSFKEVTTNSPKPFKTALIPRTTFSPVPYPSLAGLLEDGQHPRFQPPRFLCRLTLRAMLLLMITVLVLGLRFMRESSTHQALLPLILYHKHQPVKMLDHHVQHLAMTPQET